ncbi:MAG: outer membrane protein assembly factor BamA [Endomicrobia bacterium]|nr:outer membrane protein assembly factor BamA [Endomicrobiia bacterium]
MKIKNFIFLFLFILINFIYSQKIAEIEFIGLRNVKESEIKTKIKTKKGSVFSPENVSEDVKEILNTTEYFENIEVNFDTTTKKLTFKFYERPYIKKIEIRGNTKISTGKIKEEIPLKEKTFYVESKLQESKDKILQLYDEKGFVYTTIRTEEIINVETNQMTIIFLINEGKKVNVEKIEIIGNKYISKRKLLSLMEIKKKKPFKESKLNNDIEKIKQYYKNNGFYDVNIDTPSVILDDTQQKVKIVINISEGSKYKIEKVFIEGNTVYSNKYLLKYVKIKPKQYYNQSEIDETIQNISELYGEKGYLEVKITPEIIKDKIKPYIIVNFKIEEGRQFYVDKIYVDGLTTTKEEVITREILLKKDDIFNSKKLRRSVEKIYNLGFIDDVKVEPQPGSTPNSIDLKFTITEGRPGMLSAGAGYSTVDKLVGNLQVSHLNLFGRAQRLNLLWEFGERRKNYEISWTEPWFLKRPVSFGVSLYDLTRIREYAQEVNAYKEERQGLEFRVGPRISDVLGLLFSYSYENVIIFDSKFPQDIPEGKKLTSSFTSQIVYDTRDNIFDPSKGVRQSLLIQVAGWGILGGDVKFYKPIFRSAFFIPTIWKLVLSFNTTLGYIEGIENFDLDKVKYEKFYVGGAETVRGYGYRSLAPENGGRFMFVFNLEYKFPIVQENNRTILQGALFYDIGGAWNEFKDINFTIGSSQKWEEQGIWDNKLKHSVGVGIRFTTPIFPIRLDWSWALNPQKGKDPLQFWFTLGQMF